MSSSSSPSGGQDPFENIFGQLARILGSSSSGPLNWDVARQVAALIAGEGQSEPNIEPSTRIRLEEFVHIAELHVDQKTGMSSAVKSTETLTHGLWAHHTLDAYHPLLEKLAERFGQQPLPSESVEIEETDANGATFAQMQQFIGPVLMGMQAGGMVGHLSRRCLGQFDLPIPRPQTGTIVLVPANIEAFASDWSLPLDELSLYVAIEEVARFVVLSRPHVHERLTTLLNDYVSGFEPNQQELQERLGSFDMSDPTNLPDALMNPRELLGTMQTPAQHQTLMQLNALVAAYVGYVDYIVKDIASRTVSSASAIAEAVKRRRVEESDGQRLVEQLFGLELNQAQFDRGDAFVNGVLERAGEDGLNRLWKSAYELPTPAEIEAPGLWLERIDLPQEN